MLHNKVMIELYIKLIYLECLFNMHHKLNETTYRVM